MHSRIRLGVLSWLLVFCGAAAAVAPSEQQVRDLFKVMRVEQTLGQMNTQMAAQMRQELPCVPTEYWQGFVDGDGATAVAQRMVPVFQRHFSGEEIEGLLKFYRSPLGQKVLTEMPAAMAEATQVGQQWGQERTRTMLQELQKKGSLDALGRCPAAPEAAESETKPATRSVKKHVRHKPVHHHKPAAKPKSRPAAAPAPAPAPAKSAAPARP
ncbi:DUF2059 domain-containing protein [Rhodanobacter thiooxydans]|uniref:DUF2059 domain-containing protein n=3 Tax=Rhodanobacter thiooxydans TaxID=416169 RepID=UPI000260DA88|nr:DUF2059 domain-containing protein [Rhodanobacter thiooxydans]EIL96641.1 hypothetical protein UUA_17390 [Rhodanobacter thiooxydans LCS2]MCW0203124.1 DUF2059 domain-containing protein [Rhodanobacter thiooxydans]